MRLIIFLFTVLILFGCQETLIDEEIEALNDPPTFMASSMCALSAADVDSIFANMEKFTTKVWIAFYTTMRTV